VVLSVEQLIAQFGSGALGPMLDQQMSSQKLIVGLGWNPRHLDAAAEIGRA